MTLVYHPELDRTVEVTEAQAVIMSGVGWELVDEPRGTFVNPLEEPRPPLEEPIPLEQIEVTDLSEAEPVFMPGSPAAPSQFPAEEAETPTPSEED